MARVKSKKNIILITLLIIFLLILCIVFHFFYIRVCKKTVFDNYKYIGHAFFNYNGETYTNSYEAFKNGYQHGLRIMEVDMLFTSDNHLVLNHDWNENKVLSYDEFISNSEYTRLDIDDLIRIMCDYSDLYIVVDTKEGDYSNKQLDIYQTIVNKTNDNNILDRFIIQLYNLEDYYDINGIYNFKNYILTTYKLDDTNYDKMLFELFYNKIHAISFSEDYAKNNITEKLLRKLNILNIKAFVYTVNSKADYDFFIKKGFSGIYTDFIY